LPFPVFAQPIMKIDSVCRGSASCDPGKGPSRQTSCDKSLTAYFRGGGEGEDGLALLLRTQKNNGLQRWTRRGAGGRGRKPVPTHSRWIFIEIEAPRAGEGLTGSVGVGRFRHREEEEEEKGAVKVGVRLNRAETDAIVGCLFPLARKKESRGILRCTPKVGELPFFPSPALTFIPPRRPRPPPNGPKLPCGRSSIRR